MRGHLTPANYGTALAWILALPILYVVSRYNYNLFHSLADGATIVIAASAFTIIWNSRQRLDNGYFLYAGIAFLFFAILDLIHMLGNKNMGIFPASYGNLGPTFYIASRYLLSISLVIAPFFIRRKLSTALMFAVYSVVTALIILSVFTWNIFPACFVEGVGLTPFKVISDYVICLILLGAIATLLVNRRAFDPRVLKIIVAAIILSIATGLTFTLYSDPFGITNTVGHFFQIASFYLIYLAFIETSLNKPQEILFRKLKLNEEQLTDNLKRLDAANAELNQEIAERRRAEEELRESEKIYHNLFTNITEEVHFWNLVRNENGQIINWRLVDANPPTLATWGRPLAEIKGKTTDEIFGPGASDHYMGVVRKIMEENVPFIFEDYFPHLDKYFRFTSIPLGEYFITTGFDITDIKKAQKLAEQNQLQLEMTNKELESFSYSVSHDLRAPLRAINGYAQMILRKGSDRFDEETRRRFEMIATNAEKMGQLIDDLLAFSRLGSQAVAKESLGMEELIGEVWQELRDINPGREMSLKICPMPTACGDRALIRLVYGNLLGNAVKFTQGKDGAAIEAGSCIQDGESVYYVRDNGIGFDMKFYDKLFGVFQRLHSDDEYKGTGIGLALIKRIINRHGGRIWAEGEVDKGASFYFTLPTPQE